MSVPTLTKWLRTIHCYLFGHDCDIHRFIQPQTLEALEIICYCRRCHKQKTYTE